MDYRIGSIVTYRSFGNSYRTVVVTERDENIKNGYAGFDGVAESGQGYWGYDDQIIEVVKF